MLVVDPSEYVGTWLLNYDGQIARLVVEGIGDPEEDDFRLVAHFTDADGQPYPVDSLAVDVHKISFIVGFTEHTQLFRGYLMTETRDAMAGYTIRAEERFGWFAILATSNHAASEES